VVPVVEKRKMQHHQAKKMRKNKVNFCQITFSFGLKLTAFKLAAFNLVVVLKIFMLKNSFYNRQNLKVYLISTSLSA